ncbi:hypothetical protein HMPREF3213_01222 [Heyndrickxia coagulans]|uniref:Uncharacterized protein n=1 Tax=Heyndrickxia coagulans TaxID=1398 RepID=A0A133KV83_HEYCO|nr:hypothetical protein HMPREF3213_01222 [Heyndrickxia coagulans]
MYPIYQQAPSQNIKESIFENAILSSLYAESASKCNFFPGFFIKPICL